MARETLPVALALMFGHEGGVLCKYLSDPYTYATTIPASLASGYTFTRSNGEDGVLLALRRA